MRNNYITGVFLFLMTLAESMAQGGRGNSQQLPLFGNAAMPSDVRRQIAALGDRVHRTGKEATVLTGELTDISGIPVSVELTHQVPGFIRLRSSRPGSGVLLFDGDARRGSAAFAANDDDLLESLALDSSEGMFWSVQDGGSLRLLGSRFGPDPKLVPNYNGPRFDIYEVTAEVRARQDRLVRTKRYYFDSASGLLMKTRYRDPGRAVDIETRFSGWGVLDGSAYPGRVERYEGNQLVFSFLIKTIVPRPKQDLAAYRVP